MVLGYLAYNVDNFDLACVYALGVCVILSI